MTHEIALAPRTRPVLDSSESGWLRYLACGACTAAALLAAGHRLNHPRTPRRPGTR